MSENVRSATHLAAIAAARDDLVNRGVSGSALNVLLEFGIDDPDIHSANVIENAGWLILARGQRQCGINRNDPPPLPPELSAEYETAIQKAVSAGGRRLDALRMLHAHVAVCRILTQSGPLSILGPATVPPGETEGTNLALIAQSPLRSIVPFVDENGKTFHRLIGESTSVQIAIPGAIEPRQWDHMVASLSPRSSLKFLMRALGSKTIHNVQALILASVLITADLRRIANTRMTLLPFCDRHETPPNPRAVSAWCAAFDRVVALEQALQT